MRKSRPGGNSAGSSPSMHILVLNCGSSSIKYSVFRAEGGILLHHGLAERVRDYTVSLERVFSEVRDVLPRGLDAIGGVGHRVVHGGNRFSRPRILDGKVIEALKANSWMAPLHNPHNIRGIEFSALKLQGVPQVAVFDTAFHSSMPPHAFTYAIPWELAEKYRIRRYGFHGISHQYVAARTLKIMGKNSPAGLSIITCHLGNGCSVAAVKGGKCIDTSMGFTPLEGLVMGTRCGDLDPAIITELMSVESGGMTNNQVNDLLNRKSGLLGISGLSPDVRDLLALREKGNDRASLALRVFTYRLQKYIGAYHAVLGGATSLVFTAGIGENSPRIRSEALEGLEGLGFILDPEANEMMVGGKEGEISAGNSRVRIFVIPTDEDRLIFEETMSMVG